MATPPSTRPSTCTDSRGYARPSSDTRPGRGGVAGSICIVLMAVSPEVGRPLSSGGSGDGGAPASILLCREGGGR